MARQCAATAPALVQESPRTATVLLSYHIRPYVPFGPAMLCVLRHEQLGLYTANGGGGDNRARF